MNTDAFTVLLVILLSAIGVLGDYFIKLSGNGPKYISYAPFFIGMTIYALTALGWFYVMKHIKLGILGVIYSLTAIILLAIVGTVFFKENLSAIDIVGIALGVTSLILLARFG